MKRKLSICLLAAVMCALTACGRNHEIYDSGEEGFTAITSVDGILFDVVSDAARNATAITNISEDMAFETDQTYVFKDGESEYFLFRIDSIVCVAQRGTSFGLRDAEDKLDAITKGNILGIYFTSPRKRLEFVEDEKDGVYKLVATVTAQVALTSDLYNDFAGRLAYLSDGTDEWAMFVGTSGQDFRDLSDETREVITYMAATMTPHSEPVREEAKAPAVSLGGGNESSTNVETVSGNEAKEPQESSEPVAVQEDAVPDDTNQQDAIRESEDIQEGTETPVDTKEPEVIEVEEIEVTVEETNPPEAADEHDNDHDSDRGYIRLNNQKNTVRDDLTVYTSDIYDMLHIGKRAYADVLTADATGYQRVEVRADKIYTGAEALAIIKDAYHKGSMMGSYFDAQQGCSYHVIHYTVSFPSDAGGYVNVKLRGMDGENLRFRGITYTQRTYDIKVSDTEYYAFYAVPNACREYAIEIGDGTIENAQNGIVSAYYRYGGD